MKNHYVIARSIELLRVALFYPFSETYYTRVHQNATKFRIDFGYFIYVLDL